MKTLIAAISAGILSFPAWAQADETDARAAFQAAAQAATLSLTFDAETLSGPGAAFLREQALAADLVMVGEQHATADIANFATAFYLGIAAAGFGVYVAEMDPWTASAAEALLDNSLEAFSADAVTRAGGLGYPFLFFQEDAVLAQTVVQHPAASDTALWGVDQVFIASGGILADLLAARAVTPEQIRVVTDFANAAAENPMFVGMGPAGLYDEMEAAFSGNDEVLTLVSAMRTSNDIYAPFTGRGGSAFEANSVREHLMRTQFLAHVEQARALGDLPDRMFFKFGGNHAMRGRTPTHVMGFGGFVEEWGLGQGLDYFSFMVECRGGDMLNPQSGEVAPCQTYVVQADSALGVVLPDGPVVVDLTRLRRPAIRAQEAIEPEIFDLVFAFDALVVLPDVEAARMIGR